MFYGENGAGKSTILEAIQHNLTGRSFRTLYTNEMIRKGCSQYKVRVLFNDNKFIQSEKLHDKNVKYVDSDNKTIKIKDLLRLNEGSVVELERLAGEPLDILANGTKIAKGEVVMVGEKFGIRFTEVADPEELIENL